MNFKKIKEKISDLRVLLALSGILLLPALFCSIFIGYIPVVVEWIMYIGGIPFAYMFIIGFVIPIGGWISNLFKRKS